MKKQLLFLLLLSLPLLGASRRFKKRPSPNSIPATFSLTQNEPKELIDAVEEVEISAPAPESEPAQSEDAPVDNTAPEEGEQAMAEEVQEEASPEIDTEEVGIEEEMPEESSEKKAPQEVPDQEKDTDTQKKPIVAKPVQEQPDLFFDIDAKRQQVVDLVSRGVKELQQKPLDMVCNLFTHSKEFILGELYLFVYDVKGTVYAHGEDANLIWSNLIDLTDWVGTPIVKEIIKMAKRGGGWVTYGWHNATKVSYVQRVEKDGRTYIVGGGFYPQSKEEAVVNLVKGGVALFEQVKQGGDPIEWAFSRMSYPMGQFVAGNLYLYALDFKGKIMAQGERPGLINTNAWDYRDASGKYVNREIVEKLKNTSNGVWVDYISKRAKKRAYAEKVTDRDGNNFFIACGYYPKADRNQVEDLVDKGYQYMKGHGKTAAVEEFSQRRNDKFRYGDLDLVVYDMKGRIIAHGANPDQIGINEWNTKDEDGHLYIQDLIKRATTLGIWMNAKVKGAFQSIYAKKIDLGLESFVITSSYYPVSKPETMSLLVQSAASYLNDNVRTEAFDLFVKADGAFRRGDLQIFVVDEEGLCYAYGDDVDLIWRNIMQLQDDEGKPFIKMFINAAQGGPSFVQTKLNGAQKVNYVVPVHKDDKKYVIGSGFYR